jgi:hypothetical protein
MFDLRSNERYKFSDYKVEYSFGPFSSEIFEADLIDTNEIGLCMQSSHRLSVGQEITLKNFMSFSSRTAVVLWIQKHEETGILDKKSDQVLFRVGLQFT